MLPSFLLVGGQRCGTTSLHRALTAHPQVFGATFHKGVNYFDLNYHRPIDWYRGHFPRLEPARRRAAVLGEGTEPMATESSGYYLYHPLAPERIARDLPEARLIMMVRDPVERAYSAYKHEVARGFESESFERALELEESRLAGEEERLATEPGYLSYPHRHSAYLARGRYAEQLRRLHRAVGPDRVLLVEAERFFADPEPVYAEVIEFVGLRRWRPATFEQHNARPGSALSELVRQELAEYFRPHDDDLEQLLGRPLAWRT